MIRLPEKELLDEVISGTLPQDVIGTESDPTDGSLIPGRHSLNCILIFRYRLEKRFLHECIRINFF